MKKLSRIVGLFLTVTALALFTACNGSDEPAPTPAPDDGDDNTEVTFDVEISNISASGASVRVIPSNSKLSYYYGFVELTTLIGTYDDDIEKFVREYVDYTTEQLTGTAYSWSDYLLYGIDSYDYTATFRGETDYVMWIAGISPRGALTTEISTFEFTTLPPTPSNNTFEVEVTNGGNLHIKPSNSDPYIFFFMPYEEGRDDPEAVPDRDIVGYAEGVYGSDISTITFTTEFWLDYSGFFTHNTEYILFVFGYDGGATTPVTRYRFVFTDETLMNNATLDHDYTWNVDNSHDLAVRFTDYGNYEERGWRDWVLSIRDYDDNEVFWTEFYTDLTQRDPVGEFVIDNTWSYEGGTALSGKIYDDQYSFTGTWWAVGKLNVIDSEVASPAFNGKVNISKEGDVYTVDVEFVDIKGNNVDIHYKGEAERIVLGI